ncbi:phosphate/phosphite/phosphonate ABC transporter substrate-binding protein [Nesterenkonia pannonica]|uniref:phosphate/phosphite/phosphonate ABC transporter substrate-binding protein n=1 Tax=Nesterenkonia pannonica TaxID=1548602 RepID=UPI00216471D3|nr:phosphate/phosphite/phosphonate ABC transporter substrate-binding protein [Nesterenkonia pannonica]
MEEGSASGFYFPQTQLNDLGVEVDPQFAGGHDDAVLNVYNGEFEIGTSFDDARTNVVDDNPDVGDELVVFAWAYRSPTTASSRPTSSPTKSSRRLRTRG